MNFKKLIVREKILNLELNIVKITSFDFVLFIKKRAIEEDIDKCYSIMLVSSGRTFIINKYLSNANNVFKFLGIRFSLVGRLIIGIFQNHKCMFYYIIDNDSEGNTELRKNFENLDSFIDLIFSLMSKEVTTYLLSI